MVERRITLKEIARQCDLAPTTVSSILHGRKTYCSEAKIARVRELVEQYNYRPNVGYNIMTGRETNIVGVVFSQKRITQHEMLRELHMDLCVSLNEHNYAMYTAVLSGDEEAHLATLRALEERGCRAFLFIGTPKYYTAIHAYLARRSLRVLGFNNRYAERGVLADQVGAYIRYLDILELAGRVNVRLAMTQDFMEHLLLPRLEESRRARYAACSMNVAHIGFVQGNSARHYFQLGYRLMREELRRNPAVEAMVFATDYHVLGAAAALADLGRPAETVDLFGMDDGASVAFSDVRLTTTRFDMQLATAKLVGLLAGKADGLEVIPGQIVHYPDAGRNPRIF